MKDLTAHEFCETLLPDRLESWVAGLRLSVISAAAF